MDSTQEIPLSILRRINGLNNACAYHLVRVSLILVGLIGICFFKVTARALRPAHGLIDRHSQGGIEELWKEKIKELNPRTKRLSG